ncbi:MAG: hypothetical protein V4733_07555 [Verrucomicrobiota bacterium]
MNPHALRNLLDTLSTSDVQFLVVGGIAVELAGYPRATFDIDILLNHEPENIARFLQALSGFGQGYARELEIGDFDLTEGCITINEDEIQIDVFTIMGGHTYADLLQHRSWHPRDEGNAIPYLNAAGLILLKSSSVRPKDRMDVEALRNLPH